MWIWASPNHRKVSKAEQADSSKAQQQTYVLKFCLLHDEIRGEGFFDNKNAAMLLSFLYLN